MKNGSFAEGARIRAARAYAGLTRSELASELGIHESTLARYERGRIPGTEKSKQRLLLTIGEITGVGPWVAYGEALIEQTEGQ